MAEKLVPNPDSEKSEKNLPAELSNDNDIIQYIQENSLDALKARFGEAEEDERIRNEGFELAKASGLIRKRPENVLPIYADVEKPKEDIPTDNDSELAKVFDSTKSEHDKDSVSFGDLNIDKPQTEKTEETKKAKEPKEPKEPKESEEPEKPKKRTTTRRKKTPVPEPAPEPTPTVEADDSSDEEETLIIRKFNTHTKVIFVDESLDDGIKRNTDSELEELFDSSEKGRKFRLWSRKKK